MTLPQTWVVTRGVSLHYASTQGLPKLTVLRLPCLRAVVVGVVSY